MPSPSSNQTLQLRVEDYLHEALSSYLVKEVDDRDLNEIFDELSDAETELRLAQERVDRLKELLSQARC